MLQCAMQVRKLAVNFNTTRVWGDGILFVRVGIPVALCEQQHSKCGQFFLCVCLSFVNFTFHPASQTSEKREGI